MPGAPKVGPDPGQEKPVSIPAEMHSICPSLQIGQDIRFALHLPERNQGQNGNLLEACLRAQHIPIADTSIDQDHLRR